MKKISTYLKVVCAVLLTLSTIAMNAEADRKRNGGGFRTRKIKETYLSSMILPISSVPIVGMADIDFRDSIIAGDNRSVIGFSAPLQLPDFGIVDKESAAAAKFSIEVLRDSEVVNTCILDLVQVPFAFRQVPHFNSLFEGLLGGRYYYELEIDNGTPVSGGCENAFSVQAGDRLIVRGEKTDASIADLAVGELASITRTRSFKVGRRNRK